MADVVTRLHRGRSELDVAAFNIPAALNRRLVDADIASDEVLASLIWFASGVVLAAVTFVLVGFWHTCFVLLLVVAVPSLLLVRWSGRRARRTAQALPLFVEGMARSLRSGASFTQSLTEASLESPDVVRIEVATILTDIERGRPAAAALRGWARRSAQAEVRIVAAALAFATENESGASLSLAGVAQTLRDRTALHGEIRSLTSQASASMQALVLLPVAFLSLDALSGLSALRFLTGNGFGQTCLALGITLDVIGALWMRSIVRRRLP